LGTNIQIEAKLPKKAKKSHAFWRGFRLFF